MAYFTLPRKNIVPMPEKNLIGAQCKKVDHHFVLYITID